MRRRVLTVIIIVLSLASYAQDHAVFNIDRLKERKSEGLGIKGFTSMDVEIKSGISDAAKAVKNIQAFETILLLDYFDGYFGVFYNDVYGFVAKQTIITDFKIESYQTVWENKVKEEIRENEVRQRIMQKEEDWERSFSETEYASDEAKVDKTATNPFVDFKYLKIIAFNFSLKNERSTSIIKNEQLNDLVEFPGRELMSEQEQDFFAIISDTSTYGRKPPALFNPKIGLVFYGKDDKILGYIDVDLDNYQLKSTIYIPAVNHHNIKVDNKGKQLPDSAENYDKIVSYVGFSKIGKEQMMEYFRKLKLNVSSYPKGLSYGFDLAWSQTGYFKDIAKLTPSIVVNYSRHSVSLGNKMWLGKYYGFNENLGSGLHLTYKTYLTPFGRRLKLFTIVDLDYGFTREKLLVDASTYFITDIRKYSFINVALGAGAQFKLFRGLYIHGEAGIGKGFSSFKRKYEDPKYPTQSFEMIQGFTKGNFWDTPSFLFRVGIYYYISS